MYDLLALIRACKAEPDDDAPRLVLADWLQDHGDAERAAFIRGQVIAPTREVGPTDPRWLGEWGTWAEDRNARSDNGSVCEAGFHRGFLRVSDYYRELYDDLPIILNPPFDWAWVERIYFGSWHDGDWSPLFESPRLLELNDLVFVDDHYRSNLIVPLAACPYVVNLKKLRLAYLHDADDALVRLSQSPHLAGLRAFTFDACYAHNMGARAFAQSQVWDGLRYCRMRLTEFGDAGLTELAGGRLRFSLETFDLSHGQYTDAGLIELAKSDRFPKLRELGIGYSTTRDGQTAGFGARGIESLLRLRTGLERLTIAIVSADPVPDTVREIAEAHPARVSIEHRK